MKDIVQCDTCKKMYDNNESDSFDELEPEIRNEIEKRYPSSMNIPAKAFGETTDDDLYIVAFHNTAMNGSHGELICNSCLRNEILEEVDRLIEMYKTIGFIVEDWM